MTLPCLQQTEDGVILSLRVQPRSSKNMLVGLQGDLLKVKLTSPPVDGAANKRCCDYLAKLFAIAKSRIVLVAGEKGRQKRVLLRGMDLESVETVLKSSL